MDDPLIGRQLSNFLIERVLGRGGMAQVYYGQDVKLQRPVAIKVIDARYRSKPSYAQRFVKEARAVAKWRHENIIQIYYADDQDDLYYYVMEYIDGQDLSALMSSYTTEGELMPDEEILRIGRAIASALDFAHGKGVIHRDVKPSNVLLSKDGRVVLGDFGLALDMQEGSSGEVFGTPHYISPEQARRSQDVVPQSDLYALGVILYEMLAGVVPFDDVSPTSVALQHITQPPPPPRSINPALNVETEQVLLKALSKAPRDRYQSGKELMDALEWALAQPGAQDEKVLPLPPIPAAVLSGQAPTLYQNPSASLDETHMRVPEPDAAPEIAPISSEKPPQQDDGRKARSPWPVAGLLGLILLLALAGAYLFYPAPFRAAMAFFYTQTVPPPTATPASAKTPTRPAPTASAAALNVAESLATSTPTPIPPTFTAQPLPSETFTPSPTLIPDTSTPETTTVDTPTSTPSNLQPSTTPTETPTFQPSNLPPSTTITPALTPTVKYPAGKRFLVFYDANGLYLINVSGQKQPLEPFAFERLNDAGGTSNRFDGWRWSQFYPILYSENCIKLEIPKRAIYPARPVQCENRYIGARFYDSDSPFVFWTAQTDSHEFRVLWKDEEVARCEIGLGACEVFIP